MTSGVSINAGYLNGPVSSLFCKEVIGGTAEDSEYDNYIIVVPPFLEEMNRSRRLLTVLSASVASENNRLVLPDLYGTGDSSGSFEDAGWDIWINDIIAVTELIAQKPYSTISFLGIRAGCLLLKEVVKKLDITIDTLFLVQPVYHGKKVMHTVLRTRVAADRFAGRKQISTDQLWTQLELGHCVETSGYMISPDLALPLRNCVLDLVEICSKVTNGIIVELRDQPLQIEKITNENGEVVYADREIVDSAYNQKKQNDRGGNLILPLKWERKLVRCRPFWQLHEYEPSEQEISDLTACIDRYGKLDVTA